MVTKQIETKHDDNINNKSKYQQNLEIHQGGVYMSVIISVVLIAFYALSVVAGNLAIKAEYLHHKLHLPWFIPSHVLFRHGDQSYTSSVFVWSFILSILIMLTVNHMMKQLLAKAIFENNESQYKLISGIGLALKAIVLPLFVLITYRVGYQAAVILDMDYNHVIYAITSMIMSVFGFMGNFIWLIIIAIMFVIARIFFVHPMSIADANKLQEHKEERMHRQMFNELHRMRKKL